MLIMSDFLKQFVRIGLKVLCIVAAVCAAVLSSAQPTIAVKTYPTDQAGRITIGPDGALWFTETVIGKIGRITTSGAMTEFALPNPNSYPFGITTGSDGALWFTEVYSHTIGRITTDGSVTEFPVSGTSSTSFLADIIGGPDGALWFTKWCTGISRITTAGVVTDYPTTSCPFGMTTGPDGALWFADMYQIGRITTDGVITTYPLQNQGTQAITVGADGALWFTGSLLVWPRASDPFIGRITTSGAITKYLLSPEQGWSYLIAAGPDGALWFTNPYDNYQLGRITTTGAVTMVPIGAPCRFPYNPFNGIVRAGNDLWLSCSNGGIVQVSFPDSTPPRITASATPKVLWPPNGRMVPVVVRGIIKDAGSGLVAGSIEYDVLDEYRQLQLTARIVPDAAGNYSFSIFLQASRRGNDIDGRRYLIRVSAKDKAGNRGVKWASVVVPH
jgi:virginiamycin B lyase